MYTIAVCVGKGGTGKTFSTLSLAVELSLQSKKKMRILVVDLDPSKNSSKARDTGVSRLVPNTQRSTLADLFSSSKKDPRAAIYSAGENYPNVDILPSGDELEFVDRLIAKRHNTDLILKNILGKLSVDYGFALLDCPPNRGTLASNALAACNGFIAPLDLDTNAVDGVLAMHRLVEDLQEEGVLEKAPTDLGAFWTRYPGQHSHARANITKFAEEALGKHLLKIKIPESTHVKEAIFANTTLQFDRKHKVAKAYTQLSKHIASLV